MPTAYRACFRTWSGAIHGEDRFAAEDDASARAIAEQLCEACSDVVDWFELWRDGSLIHKSFAPAAPPPGEAHRVTLRMQHSLIEREEMIRDSSMRIARSRRLLERIRQLTDDLGWRHL
jgi:hypothetical protein